MISQLVCATLRGMGLQVVDLGLSTTPTVEVAVQMEKASGGIILTASHNPGQWNALKLLNEKGEFLSEEDGAAILKIAEEGKMGFDSALNINSTYKDYTKTRLTQIDVETKH